MATVLVSGHGKGKRSDLLMGISEDGARRLVGAFKPADNSRSKEPGTAKKSEKLLVIRLSSETGHSGDYVVTTSKKARKLKLAAVKTG